MTYITGYKNGKGPYITAAASGYGGTGSNKNVARDILIWGLSIRNTGSTAGEKLIIYENAASTDHASSVDSDFIVFENYLDAGDHTGDLEGYVEWDLETPILARNGMYIVGDTNIDWVIMYNELPSCTPYDSTSSPSAGDRARSFQLYPDIVCTRVLALQDNTDIERDLSAHDCEIWGVHVWNTEDSANLLRVKGDSSVGSFRVGPGNQNTAQVFKLFKIPMYTQGKLEIESKTEAGGASAGLQAAVLFREMPTNGLALDSANRR